MPIYEFSCQKCGKVFEEIMAFSALENLALECPDCQSTLVSKGLSSFATVSGDDGGCPSAGSCGNAGFT